MHGLATLDIVGPPAHRPPFRQRLGSPVMRTPGECREWLETNIPLLRRIITDVCRRGRVSAADTSDFVGATFLKLVERDYAVLRRFEGRSTLSTYLQRVVRRHLLDWRNARWGKWRPSARAKRAGDAAVRLERLTVRDGMPASEAIQMLVPATTPGASTINLTMLPAVPLSRRCLPRRLQHGYQLVGDGPVAPDRSDTTIEHRDLSSDARRVSSELLAVLRALPDDDRALLAMRFHDGMSIHDIAVHVRVPPKRLYRRFAVMLDRLRVELERRQLGRREVAPLIGHPEVTVAEVMSAGCVAAGARA